MDDISRQMADAAARQIKGATIAWGNGQCYDFAAPNPEIICLEDMAYALAYTVRWRGQTRSMGKRCFYGVGQHIVFGVEEMMREGHDRADLIGFLFHEPDEVVLPDMPGPCKNAIPGWRDFARIQGQALLDRFGQSIRDPDLIKAIDIRMMVTEKRDLMPGHERDRFQTSDNEAIMESIFQPFERVIYPYSHPDQAAIRFMKICNSLGIKEAI